ncbi:hypothetical protein C8C85_0365 [Flavobacterium sp. 103]|jgi:hypothetical protein|nr:hypothetical protein C8C85_0365 [Flavobacterium sp. 103]
MSRSLKSLFVISDIPDWFLIICILISLPILACPIVFYFSIFMFDSPKSGGLEFLYFLLINSYSFVLIANALLSFHFYRKSKIIGTLILLIPLALYILLGKYFMNI